MKSFTFTVPQNIIVGQGSIARLPEAVRALGASRVFFVSDPFLAKVGALQKCMDQLTNAGVSSEAFTETEGNPSVETVDKATAQFKASGADCIVALGGGSPMDVAKAVGVLEKDISFGFEGVVYTDMNSAMKARNVNVPTANYVGGLGGRSISKEDIAKIYDALLAGNTDAKAVEFVNLRREICGAEC